MKSLRVDGSDRVHRSDLVVRAGDGIRLDEDDHRIVISATAGAAGAPAWDAITGKPASFPASAHTHQVADVAGLGLTLAAKAEATDVTAALLTKADASALAAKADVTALQAKADTTALTTGLAGKANSALVPNASYRTLLDCSGSHTAGRVAGLYGMSQGQPLAITGVGTLYPLNTIFLAAADWPTVDGLPPKLRIRAQLYTNDVAPTGNFAFGLYPITRPATSGGAGLVIYTLGAVVAGSNGATFAAPAADGLLSAVGADFALPANGHYVIGVLTTTTVAANAHLHVSAQLQMRNA